MLKNEIDVLVIAHNICVAFDQIDDMKVQTEIVRKLREIEKEAISKRERRLK